MDVKKALVIGGTGSLGKEIVTQLLSKYPNVEVTVLSRCEHKQQAMKKLFPKVRFVLGNVRDVDSLNPWFKGKDVVFHVAALKCIDILEENPIESIKTNIIGTINVANCCIAHDVKYCMFSSTDKAVSPINTYGFCKAASEKLLLEYNRNLSFTHFSVYRWGNVLSSTGSAIPFFIENIKENKPVDLTDPKMTRFWIQIPTAVKFILDTFHSKESLTEIMIPPMMKGAKVTDVISCLGELLNREVKINLIGLRRGEKMYEELRSIHEKNSISSENCPQYTRSELKELLRPYALGNKPKPITKLKLVELNAHN